jgi:hypothetical protein
MATFFITGDETIGMKKVKGVAATPSKRGELEFAADTPHRTKLEALDLPHLYFSPHLHERPKKNAHATRKNRDSSDHGPHRWSYW